MIPKKSKPLKAYKQSRQLDQEFKDFAKKYQIQSLDEAKQYVVTSKCLKEIHDL